MSYGFDCRFIIKKRKHLKEGVRVEGPDRRAVRNLDQEVEMVAHEAVGGYAEAAESLQLSKNGSENFLFIRMKKDPAIHHPGDAVIETASRSVSKDPG